MKDRCGISGLRSAAMVVLSFCAGFVGWPLAAQPTNLEVFQQMTAECLGRIDTPDSLMLRAASARPYVRTAVIESLLSNDVAVFSYETDQSHELSVLRIEHEPPLLSYERDGGRLVRRASIVLTATMEEADGRVTGHRICEESYEDRVDKGRLARLEHPSYPETSAPRPETSWRKRYAEPVLMAGATAVTVLLFFSLRSKRTPAE